MASCMFTAILFIVLLSQVVADVDGLTQSIQIQLFNAAYFFASAFSEWMRIYPLLRFVSLSW